MYFKELKQKKCRRALLNHKLETSDVRMLLCLQSQK